MLHWEAWEISNYTAMCSPVPHCYILFHFYFVTLLHLISLSCYVMKSIVYDSRCNHYFCCNANRKWAQQCQQYQRVRPLPQLSRFCRHSLGGWESTASSTYLTRLRSSASDAGVRGMTGTGCGTKTSVPSMSLLQEVIVVTVHKSVVIMEKIYDRIVLPNGMLLYYE